MVILSLLGTATWAECKVGGVVLDIESSNPTSNAANLIINTGQKLTTQLVANTDIFGIFISKDAIVVPQSNIFSIEYLFKRPINLKGDELISGFMAGTSNEEGVVVGAVSVGDEKNSGPTSMVMTNPSSELIPQGSNIEEAAVENIRVGIYYNQNTKKIGSIINGVNKGYQWTYTTPLNNFKFLIGVEIRRLVGVNNYPIGQNVSYEIISDHSKMQFNYPSGTTDICGTVI